MPDNTDSALQGEPGSAWDSLSPSTVMPDNDTREALLIAIHSTPINASSETLADAILAAGFTRQDNTTEWEWGYTTKWGTVTSGSRIEAETCAKDLRTSISSGRESGDLEYHGLIRQRTRSVTGPWLPVPTEGKET